MVEPLLKDGAALGTDGERHAVVRTDSIENLAGGAHRDGYIVRPKPHDQRRQLVEEKLTERATRE